MNEPTAEELEASIAEMRCWWCNKTTNRQGRPFASLANHWTVHGVSVSYVRELLRATLSRSFTTDEHREVHRQHGLKNYPNIVQALEAGRYRGTRRKTAALLDSCRKRQKKIADQLRGTTLPDWQRKLISQGRKQFYVDHPEKKLFGAKNPQFGKHNRVISDTTRAQMAERRKVWWSTHRQLVEVPCKKCGIAFTVRPCEVGKLLHCNNCKRKHGD